MFYETQTCTKMTNSNIRDDCATRRRSLLPQRSNLRNASTSMETNARQDNNKAKTPISLIDSRNPESIHSGSETTNSTNLRPLGSLNKSCSLKEQVRERSLRKPSINRPSCQDAHRPLGQTQSIPTRLNPNPDLKIHSRQQTASEKVRQSSIPAMVTISEKLSTKSQKPAFSAMQQRFSPKKRPISRPSSSPLEAAQDQAAASAVQPLQIELSQLHLLHRSAHLTQLQWERSARRSFNDRLDALRDRHQELREIANQQQALFNQLALVEWCDGRPGAHLVERLRSLSRNITNLCDLIDLDGKYTRILNLFESWFAQALVIRNQRDPKLGQEGAPLNFIESIGDGWKAEAMVLERELIYCLRELKSIGAVRSSSSLGRLQSLYSKLTVNLIEELDTMQWIEDDITLQEGNWVENAIQRLASDVTLQTQ